MRAIVVDESVSDLDELQPTEASYPKPYGARELQVRITHAAITHVDVLYAQGLHQNNRRHVKPPFILGTELAGIVTSSPAFSSLKPGMRVFGSGLGSFAEHICIDEGSVHKVPEQWSNAEACAVGASGAVSWASLIATAKLKEGETVLVLGASGGLGVMAVQIAKAVGARVIAAVGNKEKARIVRDMGADEVLGYNLPGWEAGVKHLTADGEGVDLVFDAVGLVESSLNCLKYRGRVVIVGFAGRDGKMEEVKANRILLKSATVMGYRFGEDSRRMPELTEAAWDGFMDLVEKGSINPIIYKEDYAGLENIPRALKDLKARETWGRAVVTIDVSAETDAKARL